MLVPPQALPFAGAIVTVDWPARLRLFITKIAGLVLVPWPAGTCSVITADPVPEIFPYVFPGVSFVSLVIFVFVVGGGGFGDPYTGNFSGEIDVALGGLFNLFGVKHGGWLATPAIPAIVELPAKATPPFVPTTRPTSCLRLVADPGYSRPRP